MTVQDTENIIRRLTDMAVASVSARITSDPVADASSDDFVDEVVDLLLAELTERLADRSPAVLRDIAPNYAGLQDLKAAVRQKVPSLEGHDRRQRRLSLIDFIVRRFHDFNPGGFDTIATLPDLGDLPGAAQVPLSGDPLVLRLEQHRRLGLRMVRGYLGTSERPNCTRLYASLELNDYLDIPSGSIVRTLDLRTNSNPMGGAVVWLLVGAEVWRGRLGVSKGEVQGRFFAGAGGGSASRGEDFTMRGEDFTMRGEDFTMRGEDFTMRGEDFTMRG